MPRATLEVQPQTYFPVALAVLELDTVIPCELWLRHADGRDPVLYRARNLSFTAQHRERLMNSGIETAWVPFSDAEAWTRYLEVRLADRVSDPATPVEERAEILVATSRSIMKEVLANPRAEDTRGRIATVADAICTLLRAPSAVAATVRLMEHDYYTYTHSLHVAVYGVGLARAAGMDADDVLAEIGRGALMHDCGKCMLQAPLLNKPGTLSDDEWRQMQLHPQYGLDILRETAWPDGPVHEMTYGHHERMDGSGYPEGIAGRRIPEVARIIGICDAFDAMTTDRSYQRALEGKEALRIIRRMHHDRYDQRLTELFIKMLLAGR